MGLNIYSPPVPVIILYRIYVQFKGYLPVIVSPRIEACKRLVSTLLPTKLAINRFSKAGFCFNRARASVGLAVISGVGFGLSVMSMLIPFNLAYYTYFHAVCNHNHKSLTLIVKVSLITLHGDALGTRIIIYISH